ncbi:TerC family protein [Sodalis-like secondary symbiont of Drepanosiphum platanoidis]|uniref:TerC family protein n=1 Tax=Sodalis-like secondary symbiont of Drepanosiphum platanoidis TaxID=2994493 RepID=UPI0034649EFC
MKFFLNPSIFVELITLIILEIVLGIDNIIFITILSDTLVPKKRNHARLIGLILALIMRLTLFLIMSWMVNLTSPILNIFSFLFSGRDIILLFGGIFLVFKSIIELHKRLKYKKHNSSILSNYSNFWSVVFQIVILDTIFSLDSIITAIGMVNKLPVMIIAVIISMFFMLLASKILIKFINSHQTIIILCLSFLLIIGLNLILEGFGFFIPKEYLYFAIGFSILIEIFNYIARKNSIKNKSNKLIKKHTSKAIIRLISGKNKKNNNFIKKSLIFKTKEYFVKKERYMITGVLSLASRNLKSIMTPRNSISWLNCQKSINKIKFILMKNPHNIFPVCDGELDKLIGTIHSKDLINKINSNKEIKNFAINNPTIVVPETQDIFKVLKKLRYSKRNLIMISDEFGIIQGLITPLDILEAIVGGFFDEDETPEIEKHKNYFLVKGSTDLYTLQQNLNISKLIKKRNNVVSLRGLLLSYSNKIPKVNDFIDINEWRFTIKKIIECRIDLIYISKINNYKL